ncbi:hypothetical protein MIMGU_mgv11b022508mg, partial [Erythranthe guttata]
MANFHSRSNSLPCKSHPLMNDVEHHLCRLKSSTETSTSANSICENLATLTSLYEEALSNEEGGNWRNELLEGSLRLVDLCGISREIVCLTKESIQELESSIRRKSDDIIAYAASRKKINKMVINNLKSFNHKSTTAIPCDQTVIGKMLTETEALVLSVLKSVLMLVSGAKGRSKPKSWSLFSKFSQTSCMHSELEQESGSDELCFSRKGIDNLSLKQLKASEMKIEEIEEGLEDLFRRSDEVVVFSDSDGKRERRFA